MIHYNVWFSLRNPSNEAEGLGVIRDFLEELCAQGEVARFQLMRNRNEAAKTKMLPFQALIEFRDEAQFSAAFAAQAARGIHNGFHGRVLTHVGEIQIEVFQQVAGR